MVCGNENREDERGDGEEDESVRGSSIFNNFRWAKKSVTWSTVNGHGNSFAAATGTKVLIQYHQVCLLSPWSIQAEKNNYRQLSPGIQCVVEGLVATTRRNGLSVLVGCQTVTWPGSQYSCPRLMSFKFHEMPSIIEDPEFSAALTISSQKAFSQLLLQNYGGLWPLQGNPLKSKTFFCPAPRILVVLFSERLLFKK